MRKLAAILFTDIVGYTALMQENEKQAAQVRMKHREIFESEHTQYQGRIIQYFGDGTLSMFDSAVEAVQCAVSMQKLLLQDGTNIPVRMGIHIGDIFFDGTEIYGHGVNVAARIESISRSGAVLVSEKVHNELENQTDISTKSVGFFSFKNVSEPVQVFAIDKSWLTTSIDSKNAKTSQGASKSVVVLPFENLSRSEEHEYFCDGMTEEIINALTKIKELKVTSRTSTFHFKGKQVSAREIGEQLGVSTMVHGSIRLAGLKMRVTVQLIDVNEDYVFWSDNFDRSLDDIFAVQDEISLSIAERLREHVGHLFIDRTLVPTQEVTLDGYNTYLKGRYHILRMSDTDIRHGISLLEQLVKESPNYVYGHLGMHMAYTMLGSLGFMPAKEAFPKGYSYLEKAIELDDSLPECNLQQSWISFLQDWDLDKTYDHLSKVHSERPIVDYYQTMASVIVTERNFKAAEHYIDIALKMDPLSDITHHLKGFIQYVQHNYNDAIEYYRKSIELKPESAVSFSELGQSLLLNGKPEEALSFYEGLSSERHLLVKQGGIALVHAFQGKKKLAEKEMKVLEEALQSESMEKALYLLIIVECALNNYDNALIYIKQALQFRLPMLVYLKIDPIIKPLHDLDDFKELFDSLFKSHKPIPEIDRQYKKSLINQEHLERYRGELKNKILEEKPYLNPHITLSELSEMMGIPANQLSQVLNAGFDQNFSEFINTFRIQHFKELIRIPEKQNFTILALAYESGFNSKTAFNTFFKRSEGMTPKAYLKSVLPE